MRGIIIGVLIIFFIGCSPVKKTKTITETVERVDTIIVYRPDTTIIEKSVFFMDTVFIETESSVSRAYFDLKKKNIVLQVRNKPIPIELSYVKKTITTESVKEVEQNSKFRLGFILGISFIILITFLYGWVSKYLYR